MGASVVALSAVSAPALAQAAAARGAGRLRRLSRRRRTSSSPPNTARPACRRCRSPFRCSPAPSATAIGISTVQDVTNFAPGFIYDPATSTPTSAASAASRSTSPTTSRVAAYEDEFFVYSPYQLAKSSLFLTQEQIERGPQNVGGRNAAGGSIDMISVRPTATPYAEVRGTVGNFGTYNIEGAASGRSRRA